LRRAPWLASGEQRLGLSLETMWGNRQMTVGRFEGKVVLVTGAGTGIGEAVCRRFAAEGAKVALVGRTESKLRRVAEDLADPTAARSFIGDVTDPAGITTTVAAVVEAWGRLDVVVNNASVVMPGTIEEVSDQGWRQVMATDVDSVFYTSRAALPYLRESRGNIVNVGSVSALRADWGQAAYNTAKGAMVNLTNAMALDHGATVRVNAVHPGVTLVNDEMRAVFAPGSPVLDLFLQRTPANRVALPEDVAGVIAFLAGPDAAFVNGVHIPVDGGLTASNGQPSQVTARAMAAEFFAASAGPA
jgi:meso-butanediol dehydrogenase/(S,S)-butanediol dehydrogenase/diacetyl reductase